jgi:tetratricopeptide (TPR) repeat protein
MHRKLPHINLKLTALFVLVCWSLVAVATIRKDFLDLENMYDRGKLNEVQDALVTLKPNSDDERACIAYYSALLKLKQTEIIAAFELVVSKYPKTEYANLSLLELGKLHILNRDISTAKTALRKISSTKLMERFYWLGYCSWWEDDFTGAINNAENYLRMEAKGTYTEAAHYLIAECYLMQRKANSAVTTLNALLNKKLTNIDEQYLWYRLGYANEMADKHSDALGFYRRGYELDKYSQVAYLIEDRIFELRAKNRSLDISFLYPYSLLQIATIPESAPTDIANTPSVPSITPTTPVVSLPNSAPVKLKAKPNSGYWLQAGRFSNEDNANRLVVNIRLLNVPAAYFEDVQSGKKSWVVVCGSFEEKTKAEAAKSILASNDINSFVTQY